MLIAILLLTSYALCTSTQYSPPFQHVYGVQPDPILADNKSFDYIVVGAGLGGTTVAARLSEDSSVSVLLIEAGEDDRRNPDIYNVLNFSKANGSLVWDWTTDLNKTIRG